MHAHIRAILIVLLTSEVIEADIYIIHTQRVEQVEDGFGHHRRNVLPLKREEWPPPRRVILDILGSIMLLEVGVARISRARSRSLPRAAGAPLSARFGSIIPAPNLSPRCSNSTPSRHQNLWSLSSIWVFNKVFVSLRVYVCYMGLSIRSSLRSGSVLYLYCTCILLVLSA